ncbi:ABC transporter substrate-binding protein [Gelria sp. Kuro-4]|uniref:ABC transporter substrate-binding protein n=1 Tax=Gelria sp. Kuro-4 TaxID=2796927 RepID=UPI001BEDDB11|nr:ABC transporter substrate-binding protein [Gelria sp. Kuro-4]BCV23489.1 ABC transporter substrate-binding protein [Gelria sp. Kuro-4]
MKRLIALSLLLALIPALLGGCSAQTGDKAVPPTPPATQEPVKATVLLDWTPNTNHTGLYVARDKDYYKEQGLDVSIVGPLEGGVAQLVAAGKADFGVSYQEEVTNARVAGIPVKAIAAVIQHNTSGFASPVEKGIKTPKDFEGRKYGGWGSPMEEAMLKALMDKHGADFRKVEMVNIGSADFFTTVKKDVDFEWIYWGWTGIEAEQRGIKLNFIKLIDEDPALDYYTPVLIASEKTLSERPELVKKFLKATSQGYEYAIAHPEEAANILTSAVPELNKDLVLASQKYLAQEYRADAPRWGEMKESVWKNYADWMYDRRVIEKNIDPKAAFTNEFLPAK